MSYKITEEGNISTVFLVGEIDMDVTEKAKEVILPLVESGKEVHLNLKDVSYMDSSGISVLIESHQKALENNTKVVIKEVSKSVLKVIMMSLESVFVLVLWSPGFFLFCGLFPVRLAYRSLRSSKHF